MKLIEGLAVVDSHKIISLVGAGGKTTLMYALARELVDQGKQVITTTTTKILKPLPGESRHLIISSDEGRLTRSVRDDIGVFKHVTIATELMASAKLKGIRAELIDQLAELDEISHVLVEADGAAQRPLKAPNPGEPVIPSSTDMVVVVAGIDSMGKPLDSENVFRAELASRLLKISLDEIITPQHIAQLVTHPQGMAKGTPECAQLVCFINKVESDEDISRALELADIILNTYTPRVNRVVLGQAKAENPVLTFLPKGK